MVGPDIVITHEEAFAANLLRRLADRIVDQCGPWLEAPRFVAPARAASTLMVLAETGALPITAIAQAIGFSHPLVVRLTGELVASGLVKTSDDPTDKRRRLVSLTVKGRSEAERIALARTTMAQATLALLEEAGVDLFADLQAVNDALDREPLHRRLAALSADRPT